MVRQVSRDTQAPLDLDHLAEQDRLDRLDTGRLDPRAFRDCRETRDCRVQLDPLGRRVYRDFKGYRGGPD